MARYSGMMWLRRPSDKPERALAEAVAYAEEKYGRPVRLIARPVEESLPDAWIDTETGRAIPVRADRRVVPHHLYLVWAEVEAAAGA